MNEPRRYIKIWWNDLLYSHQTHRSGVYLKSLLCSGNMFSFGLFLFLFLPCLCSGSLSVPELSLIILSASWLRTLQTTLHLVFDIHISLGGAWLSEGVTRGKLLFFFAAGLAEGTCEVKGGVDIVAGQLLYMVKLEERKRACSEKKKGMQDVQTNALSRQCAGMCYDKTSSNCEMDSQESIKVPSQHTVSSKFCWRNARTQMIKMSFHSWLLNSPQCFYLMMNLQGVNRETGEWKLLLRNPQKQP